MLCRQEVGISIAAYLLDRIIFHALANLRIISYNGFSRKRREMTQSEAVAAAS